MIGFKSCFGFLFITLLFFSEVQAQNQTQILYQKYSPQELKSDLTLFKNVIIAMHPAVGIYHPKHYYSNLFDEAIQNITDSMNEKSFRIYCKQLSEELHCGHTEVMASKPYLKAITKAKVNYSPYVFLPVEDRLFVVANLNRKKDSTINKGVEVLSLNSIPSDSLMRHCRKFISADGYNQSAKYHFVQLGFNNLYPSLFGRPDSICMEYNEDGVLKKHNYSSIQLKNIPPLPLKKKEDSLFKVYKKAKLGYRENKTKPYLILKVDKFSHTHYKRVYRRVFKKLEKDSIHHLVLDLRNNGGGSLSNAYKLLSYLIDDNYTQTLSTRIKKYPEKKYTKGNLSFKLTRAVFSMIGTKSSRHDTDYYVYKLKLAKHHRYNGKLYVLMNGGSFSASCLVGAYLKGRENTLFLGEESGGAAEGCNAGITPIYKLPATGVRIRIPAFRINNDIHSEITGHGLLPDYKIVYSFKDLISKKDLELDKVIELLNLPQ